MNIQLFAQRLTQSCHDSSRGLSHCTVFNRYDCPFYPNANQEMMCRSITIEQWMSVLKGMTEADGGAETESDHDAHASRGSVLLEAMKVINGERVDQYGEPEDCFSDIAEAWQKWLGDVSRPITRRDVAVMMALLKLVREMHNPKRDNLRDACGYLALAADMVEEPTDA